MKSFGIIAIIGSLVFLCSSVDVLAQCSQRIEILNIATSEDEASVNFDVKVIASEVYKGQLVRIEGTEERLIKSFSGSGDESFSFSGLDMSEDIFYRVIIEYASEKEFLCKRRVKDVAKTDTK